MKNIFVSVIITISVLCFASCVSLDTVNYVSVSNIAELVDAIASNTFITLEEGIYDVSTIYQYRSGDHGRNERTLNISGITGLMLQAAPGAAVEIVTPDLFAEVIVISNSNNITIKNIKMGHSVTDEYDCDAGVLYLDNAVNVTIQGCYIYGSGAIGIDAKNCHTLNVWDSIITDCSLYAVDLWKCDDVNFINCELVDHRAYMNVIRGYETQAVFADCTISGNKYVQYGVVYIEGDVMFDRCVFTDNGPADGYSANVLNGRGISVRDCLIEKGFFNGYWNEIVDLGGNDLVSEGGSTYTEVSAIKSIKLLDSDLNPLSETDGWVHLQANSIIEVEYSGAATHAEFYTVPTGTEVTLEQRIIGRVDVKKEDRTVRFEWNVQDSFLGYIWVVVYNGDIGRTSNTNEFLIKAIFDNQADNANAEYITDQEYVTYDGVKYTSNGGNVTITGYEGYSRGVITIPKELNGLPVTEIGNEAFASLHHPTGIILPDSVVIIGNEAFMNMWVDFDLGNGIKSIGDYAFKMNSMSRIVLPDSLESIGQGAFYDCFGLEQIVLPSQVKRVETETFKKCPALTRIVFTNPDIEIAPSSFDNPSETDIIIYGYENSAAEQFAKDNGYNFKPYIPIKINGNEIIPINAVPEIVDGDIYVPLSFIVETLNHTVEYYENDGVQQVIIDGVFYHEIGTDYVTYMGGDNLEPMLNNKSYVDNGVLMVDPDMINQVVKCDIIWDTSLNTIEITARDNNIPDSPKDFTYR